MAPDDEDAHTDLSVTQTPKKTASTYIGRVIAGRYRIVGPVGRGGAGNVYRGVQEPLGREVAVKILRPDLSPDSKKEWQARFLREAALAGRLSHPNVITVHDYGVVDDGASFVVMELVNGLVMSDMIARGKALDPARAANLVCQIARGLRAVHDAELVHRDVKPHNVMVVEQDGRERAVLLDFGLVKFADMADSDMDSYKTRAGTYMGTPAYMAPEQAKGASVDHRADLYALGCLLFRLLTGHVPFSADHPLGMAVQHMTEPIPTFASVAPKLPIPHRLEKITRRLMEKDPDRRYRTAGDLVSELEKFLEDPPLPRPAPAPVGGAVGAGVGAVGAGLGLLGVFLAVGAIFVALVVVMLFAQEKTADTGVAIEPAVPIAAPVMPAPEPSDAPSPVPAVPDAGTPGPKPEPAPVPSPAPAPRPDPQPVAPVPAPTPTPAPGPSPLPMPMPSGKPTPIAAPPPTPTSAPAEPSSKPVPAPSGPAATTVDEVAFTEEAAVRALGFVNTATAEQLAAAGVYDRGVQIILDKRPFASLEAFGGTYGIGKKTMQRVRDAR